MIYLIIQVWWDIKITTIIFLEHVPTVSGRKIFTCTLCEYSSITKKNLKRHDESEHKLRLECKHACDTCSFSSKSLLYLKKHKKSHHRENVRDTFKRENEEDEGDICIC